MPKKKKSSLKKLVKFNEEENNLEEEVIHSNYILLKKIGKGAFGKVFIGWNIRDQIEVAIKIETINHNQVEVELIVLKSILIDEDMKYQDYSGMSQINQNKVLGIPRLYGYGKLQSGNSYLISECLGPNLMDLFNYCGKKFTLLTVCLLAIQILNRIEVLHSKGFIHRDIKPENFSIGMGNDSNVIYLIDYGLAKQYRDSKSKQHIQYKEGKTLKGTARYVSINTHLGVEQSRRDDLESIGYLLLFFLKGSLPWQGIKGGVQQYEKIYEKKIEITIEALCKDLPNEIYEYFKYVKNLMFDDKPDYKILRSLFLNIIDKLISKFKINENMIRFDWVFDNQTQIDEFYNLNDKEKEKKTMSLFKYETFNNNQNEYEEKGKGGRIEVVSSLIEDESEYKDNYDIDRYSLNPINYKDYKEGVDSNETYDDRTLTVNMNDYNSSNEIDVISESIQSNYEVEEIDKYIQKRVINSKNSLSERILNDIESVNLSGLLKDKSSLETPVKKEKDGGWRKKNNEKKDYNLDDDDTIEFKTNDEIGFEERHLI